MRKKIIAGNWKMNLTVVDAGDLARGIQRDVPEGREVDVVLCPPFTALKDVGSAIEESLIKLGAQDMHWEAVGAYTGEISAAMLRDLYCRYVILGHSERRQYFGETDDTVNRKVAAAMEATLVPIMCVGETLEQREGGETQAVVRRQLEGGLKGIDLGVSRDLVIAYEPVWAIGTGRTASPQQAQDTHAYIREILGEIYDASTASRIRIQYGGSMKPENAEELLEQPDIDGGLIGGASLEVRSFVEVIRAAIPKDPDVSEHEADWGEEV
jgi:triosephosphate isomerase